MGSISFYTMDLEAFLDPIVLIKLPNLFFRINLFQFLEFFIPFKLNICNIFDVIFLYLKCWIVYDTLRLYN